jgi:hypothetical protein
METTSEGIESTSRPDHEEEGSAPSKEKGDVRGS